MNVHKNAVLTPSGRALLVQRYLAGESAEDVAQAMGVSPPTVYKWVKRWKAQGERGLRDRSSWPHRSPSRLPRHRRRQIERLRRKRWTTPRIARELGMPLSTLGRECRRLGLGKLSSLNLPAPVIRYERDRPGELLHLDTKKFGRIGQIGHRIHGDRSVRTPGAGWEFLHICVDDATRLTYAEVLPDERGETAAGFLKRAVCWFAAQGRPPRVMTDNGSCYVSNVFAAALKTSGARHVTHAPTRRGPTGRRSGSSAPPRRAGPTPGRTDTQTSERPSYGLSSLTTTADVPMEGSEA